MKIKKYFCGNGDGMYEDENGYWITINDVRLIISEVLKEAAENATVFAPWSSSLHGTKNVDKESILNLQKQLEEKLL